MSHSRYPKFASKLASLLSLYLLLTSCSEPANGVSFKNEGMPPAPTWETSAEYEATLRMISAHEPLRETEVADATSPSNRLALETMIKKALLDGPSKPIILANTSPIDGEIMGNLDESFSVDNKGNGKYQATLPIPESRANLSPDLSLSYTSRSGVGALGRGFYASTGFHHAITRGRSFWGRDNEARGIEMDDSDKFYLGGKRLLCTSGPETYGRPGSSYRTEVDGFLTITAAGTADQITSFVLKDKHGRIYTFGAYQGSDDACHRGYQEDVSALHAIPYNYALKRVEDSLGNFVDLDYEHLGFGEWVLKEIRYTGFKDQAPNYAISYQYRKSDYPKPNYQSLQRFDENHILESISISTVANQTPISRYDLIYAPLDTDRDLRLAEIRSFLSPEIGAPLQALSPTRFNWSQGFDPKGDFPELNEAKIKTNAKNPNLTLLADFNHDGKIDCLTFDKGIKVALSDAQGFGKNPTTWLSSKDLSADPRTLSIDTGDFDGDGLQDLFTLSDSGKLKIFRSTGSAFEKLAELSANLPDARKTNSLTVGDFNGDGRDEVLLDDRSGQLRFFASRGQNFDHEKSSPSPSSAQTELLATRALDLNEDGLDDYVALALESDPTNDSPTPALIVRYQLSLPGGTFASAVELYRWSNPEIDKHANIARNLALFFSDFNGDSRPDLLAGTYDANSATLWKWELVFSKSHTTNLVDPDEQTRAYLSHAIPVSIEIGDDGQSLHSLPHNTATHSSNNAPHSQLSRIRHSLTIDNGSNLIPLDVNQDGNIDIVWKASPTAETSSIAANWYASLSQGDGTFAPAYKLQGSVWNNLNSISNSRTEISYADIDGDGLSDWITKRQNSNGDVESIRATSGANSQPSSSKIQNVMTSFVDGKGRITCAAYKASRDDSVYTPGAKVRYPIREVRNALPVVSDIWRDLTGGEFLQYSYYYSGQRTDLSGRGNLGFAAFITIDRQTGFLSYQHLEQSYPMTGLVSQEEVYRTWEEGNKFYLKAVKFEKNSVLFDAVVDPFAKHYFGTIYPYVSQEIKTNWVSDSVPHYSFLKSKLKDFSAGNSEFKKPIPVAPPFKHTTHHWFDQQPQDRDPAILQAVINVPYELEKEKPASSPRLPGLITYGNQTTKRINYGYNMIESEYSSYYPPTSPLDSFTSLRKTYKDTKIKDVSDEESTPPSSYSYFPNSTLWATYSVDKTNDPLAKEKTVFETHYKRDERGNLTERYELTIPSSTPEGEDNRVVTYTATDYDNALDLPNTVAYKDGELRWILYNPIFREARQTKYERGITVSTLFDPLGRKTRISNISYNYLLEAQFEWTSPDRDDWRQTQIILPPPGVVGFPSKSRYVERTDESNEPTVITYFDRTEREIRRVEISEESTTYVDSIFDRFDRLVAQTKPYQKDEPIIWIHKHYDDYGSLKNETEIEIKPELN